MSLKAYSGGAGCGKTYSVVNEMKQYLGEHPFQLNQRLLALTFMHGARHRLNHQLGLIAEIRGRFEAMTIDSFAFQLCTRWNRRIILSGREIPQSNDFEGMCDTANFLLSSVDIQHWVHASFPIIIVDEAQDLLLNRLEIIEKLSNYSHVILAYDDYQCLNKDNRPVAINDWIIDKCDPIILIGSRRTQVNQLITAANRLRTGQSLSHLGTQFRIVACPVRRNVPPGLAGFQVGTELIRGGKCAIITPSSRSSFPRSIVDYLSTTPIARLNLRPQNIYWESEEDSFVSSLKTSFESIPQLSFENCIDILNDFQDNTISNQLLAAIKRRFSLTNSEFLPSNILIEIIDRVFSQSKAFRIRHSSGIPAMTIQQAKNREFDHIVVIWPFEVPNNIDYRRRLLYNAITRAKQSCIIILQNESQLLQAPFIALP